MKERFEYKPGIKSIAIKILCIIGGIGVFYLGGIKGLWGADTVATVLLIACPLWTLYFIYSVVKAFKERSGENAYIEVDDEFLNVQGQAIPWGEFLEFKIIPVSDNASAEMLSCYFKKESDQKSLPLLESDNFDSKSSFDDFIKLITHHTGKDVGSVTD